MFKSEQEFEDALVAALQRNGWEDEIINRPTERDLIDNWAQILFNNNREQDRLNDVPLTETEMRQIIDQLKELKTPAKINSFVNGTSVAIKRDNPADRLHYGKEVSLKIYDRKEIGGGSTRYQIVRQPIFYADSNMKHDRRGDVMLLINGMPLIHIELKSNKVALQEAINQIQKYAHEGIFTGIFSMIQIFVAMTPEETKYFANPGAAENYNEAFQFHWADFNNDPINTWDSIASTLLSIPMAHQMIGYYTIADKADGVLKVLRSYQYYAANAISDTVSKIDWESGKNLGGYVWHTTGAGKTMTSFKSAQLIASSKDADKVIFLMDRIELGTQSLQEYRNFAEETEDVQGTEDTHVLIAKLRSNDPANTLIVSSIQKMSKIKEEGDLNASVIEELASKRIVFIIDECHRSTFGEMLVTIKETFPNAVFFGFTGTPIEKENQKKKNTTSTIFGNELHRYSIADGIRDGNVLGFDIYKVSTYDERALRKKIALLKAGAQTVEEAIRDPQKSKVYYHYLEKVPMAGQTDAAGNYVSGIEDEIRYLTGGEHFKTREHHEAVVNDILEHIVDMSRGYQFHGMLATSSIPEAIEYYRIFKERAPHLKVTALFDPNIDNKGGVVVKEEGLIEILDDYNKMYDQNFTLPTHALFKKDVAARLAHKVGYKGIEREQEKQLDLLIVVDQMLTGFDSKWVNVLYMDKVLVYANLIQAISRTNRLFGHEKPHGTVRYYRYPFTMGENIDKAVKLYSGDRPFGLFVQHLDHNLRKMNDHFLTIKRIFDQAGIPDFSKLPDSDYDVVEFVKEFNELNDFLDAARLQGFSWKKSSYTIELTGKETAGDIVTIDMYFDEQTYLILAKRYKELLMTGSGEGERQSHHIPLDIENHIVQIDTTRIDREYMESMFVKYRILLNNHKADPEEVQQVKEGLHKSFALLGQEEQKYANLFLNDIERGKVVIEEGKSFSDYLVDYHQQTKNNKIDELVEAFGVDRAQLNALFDAKPTALNLDDFGRFTALKETVNKAQAIKYFKDTVGETYSAFKVGVEVSKHLKDFLINGALDDDK